MASVRREISPSYTIQVHPIGSGVIKEAFIPVRPTVQLGGRLVYPTEGFYYHFCNKKLVQEYKIVGGARSSFYGTRSSPSRLSDQRNYNRNQVALLAYWKLAGKLVKNQHIVYLKQQITMAQLHNLTDDWLAENGIKLNIQQLLDTRDEPTLIRKAAPPKAPPEPDWYKVHTDPKTGQREEWPDIAQRYGLTARALLDMNPQFSADPMALKVGDILTVKPFVIKEPEIIEGFPPQMPRVYNAHMNSYYTYTHRNINQESYRALNEPFQVTEDIVLVNLTNVTTPKVFAKSCTQAQGCMDAGIEDEPISNFGPWAFFFGQAHANPAAVIPAIQVAQASSAMASSASLLGTPENENNTASAANELSKVAGTLQSKLVDGYRWKVDGIQSLFLLQQEWFGDDTQYTEDDLRQETTAQSRIRIQLTDPNEGEHYPTVRAHHVDDSHIPVRYVGKDETSDNDQFTVTLTDNGPTITWTPIDGGNPEWQLTPNQDDGFTPEDILVTPIHSGDDANVEIFPALDSDWRDAVLVFPVNSGIAPLYIVYKESERDKPGVVTGQGKDVEWKDGYWLGEAANTGQGQYIPTKIADALRGKEFLSFDKFREAFWIEVAKVPELMGQFKKQNRVQIKQGNAPTSLPECHIGKRKKFEIHHIEEIQHGGAVYDIDNLRVNTPKNHIRKH